MEQLSDEALFAAYQDNRDVAALSVLFRRRADELLRLAVFLVSRPSDAEDIVQATFLKAIARADTYRKGFRVMSWLCGILTNNARMLRRSEHKSQPAPTLAEESHDPVSETLHAELRQVLRQSIGQLGEPYSSVLRLHLNDGLNSQEISERLHRPPATVRKQMARAIQSLRQMLPLGLATSLVVKMSPAQIASNAADAAAFVDTVGPVTRSELQGDDLDICWEAIRSPIQTGLLVSGALLAGLLAVFFVVRGVSPIVEEEPSAAEAPAVAVMPDAITGVGEVALIPPRQPVESVGRGFSLTVNAKDPDGAAHVGVELSCVHDDGRALTSRMLSGRLHRATTDSLGVVCFEGLVPGRYELTVAGSTPQVSVQITDRDLERSVTLPVRREYRGTVTDAQGHPVAGASVFVCETGGRAEMPHQVAVTDSTGYFVGSCLLARGRVFARHPEHSQSACSRLSADYAMQLELEPLVDAVEIRVVDQEQRPVTDCFVSVVPRSQWSELFVPLVQTTDKDGRCVLPGPGDRLAMVVAQRSDMSAVTIDLDPSDTEVLIEMSPSVRIEGVVHNHEGAPFGNREVVLTVPGLRTNEPTSLMLAIRSRSDAEGRFVFAHAPRAEVHLRIYAKRRVAGPPVSQHILASLELDASDGESAMVEMVSRPLTKISGVLRTASGRPIEGHYILASPSVGVAQHRMFRRRSARTDAEGYFEIDDVAHDELYSLGVYPPGRWWPNKMTWPVKVATATCDSRCEIVIDPSDVPASSLVCQVLQPGGKPARRASIELRHLSMHVPDVSMVDASGRARFTDLLRGDYWVVILAPGLGSRTMQIKINGNQEVVDLGAVQLERAARVSLRLVGEGLPMRSSVRVIGRSDLGDKFVTAWSRKDGTVSLPALPPGEGSILIHGLGVAPYRLEREFVPGMQWIDFELSKASKVAMRFTFPRVENPFLINGPLHVRVSDLAGQLVLDDYVGGASGPGRFDLGTGLLPGRYRVKARSVWNAHVDVEIVVPEGNDLVQFEWPLVH